MGDAADGAGAAPKAALEVAKELKDKGNEAFARGEMEDAVRWYSEAIDVAVELLRNPPASGANPAATAALVGEGAGELVELLPTLFGNRSAASHKLGRFTEALRDAEQSLAVKPMWAKGHHRKAQALVGLGELDRARDAYNVALDGDPENKFLRRQADELDARTGHQSAHAKIDKYVQENGTIKGCPTKLSLSMFQVEDVLGEGNYSTVTKVVFKKTGELFAIKSVDKSKVERMSKRHPNIHNELRMEKRIMLRLNHPNVAKLYHTMQDVSALYFVQELCEGGELWAKLRFGRNSLVSLRPSLARFYAAQVVNALDYLRLSGVVHRDIKPENMMLCPVPGTNGRVEFLKLIDFGTAYDLVETDLNGPKFVGTPEYMSPEAIAAKADPTPTLDVWALGSTVFQLNSGRLPFKGSSPYLTFLKTKALKYTMPRYFDADLQDMLRAMFKEDPGERLGAKDEHASIKRHPYFAGIDFAQLQQKPIVPVPTLFQLCLEAALKPFLVGSDGPDAKLAGDTAKRKASVPAWAMTTGVFAANNVAPRVRDRLMGYMAQRLILGKPWVFRLFFESDAEARFRRATPSHAFIGQSEQEQGKFTDAFLVVHVGSLAGATPAQLEAAMRRLNVLQPTPRLVVFSGALGQDAEATKRAICALDSAIPIVCARDSRADFEDRFGERYYSLHVGGVLVIVVDSFLLAELDAPEGEVSASAQEHAEWFESEVLQGKLCARHVIVVSHHAWTLDAAGDGLNEAGEVVLPQKVAERFLDKLQEAGTQMVLCGGASRSFAKTHKPQSDVHARTSFTHTGPFCASDSACRLRLVRVQDSSVVADTYAVDELPPFISLEHVELEVDQAEADDKEGFSDISSSSEDEA